MSNRTVPRIAKWPFLFGDVLLLCLAAWIVFQNPRPLDLWLQILVISCVAAACWLGVWPFIEEYRATLKIAEADGLAQTVDQVGNLQIIAEQIRLATGQWQTVQDHAGKTVTAANEIADRMTEESKAFQEFMQRANDAEKGHLRLEVEKLRRAEGDWLQLIVNLLDHVHALRNAGIRSGQPNLVQQLNNFQHACRDVARRAGIVAIDAEAGHPFNAKVHEPADGSESPPEEATIAEVLATGFTYQGQLVRRCLVRLQPATAQAASPPPQRESSEPAAPADSATNDELALGDEPS